MNLLPLDSVRISSPSSYKLLPCTRLGSDSWRPVYISRWSARHHKCVIANELFKLQISGEDNGPFEDRWAEAELTGILPWRLRRRKQWHKGSQIGTWGKRKNTRNRRRWERMRRGRNSFQQVYSWMAFLEKKKNLTYRAIRFLHGCAGNHLQVSLFWV